jgi:hypothetical protein
LDLSPTRPRHSVSKRKSYTNVAGANWLVGSVKRAISSSLGARSASLTAATKRKPVPDPTSYQSQATGISTSASPNDSDTRGIIPRRAASDAAFWKSKRGAQDWGEEDKAPGERGEDEEWDVEAAARNRVVQLMFTVPREQLRVVNADVDGASLVSYDGKAEREDAGMGMELDGNVGN